MVYLSFAAWVDFCGEDLRRYDRYSSDYNGGQGAQVPCAGARVLRDIDMDNGDR